MTSILTKIAVGISLPHGNIHVVYNDLMDTFYVSQELMEWINSQIGSVNKERERLELEQEEMDRKKESIQKEINEIIIKFDQLKKRL